MPSIFTSFDSPQYTRPLGDYSRVRNSPAGVDITNTLASEGTGILKSGASSIGATLNGSSTRLSLAGLLPGGGSSLPLSGINQESIRFGSSSGSRDWRVKCSVAVGSGVLYDMPSAGVMEPIKKTNGVIFPYAPSLTIQHQARYNPQSLTHSNYNNFFYEGSEVQAIQITADFTVQNTAEAAYFLAAIYFFRAATKMFYGESGKYQGAPPPIVYLDGYGTHYLPHVPCVVTSFSHTMPAEVDYIEVAGNAGKSAVAQSGSGASGFPINSAIGSPNITGSSNTSGVTEMNTRVPTASQITVSFQPVYSRSSQRSFDLEAFSKGELVTKGYL